MDLAVCVFSELEVDMCVYGKCVNSLCVYVCVNENKNETNDCLYTNNTT